MKTLTFWGRLLGVVAALSFTSSKVLALENGVDPWNLGHGDWIWSISVSTNKLNGKTSAVTDIPSLMSWEKEHGISFIIVKAGTGSTNYPTQASPQFTSNLVYQAHLVGLKIFAYTRSYGDNVPGEIAMATNCMKLGADGFVLDAEAEWESSRQGTQGPAKAIQLCSGIKAVYPFRFLGHAPFPYITLHSSFPYKEFGYYCDAVMPQCYWNYSGVTPTQMVADLDSQFTTWQNSLTGIWTNAIKPIAPIGQADLSTIPSSELTTFADTLKADASPATPGGYKGLSWWDCQEHALAHWTTIDGITFGDPIFAPDIVVDNTAATMVGTWTLGNTSADRYGADYRYKGQGTGTAYLQFTPNLPVAGNYRVYEWHPEGSNRTTNAPCTITYNGGSTTVAVNQKVGGGSWVSLGVFNFAAGTAGSVKIADNFPDATQLLMADAIRFAYVIPAPTAPNGLTATAVAGPQINLSWNDNSTNEINFVVARATKSGGPYTDIAYVSANTRSFVDESVAASTTYYYVVRASNSGGSSANSAQASATTSATVADIIIDNTEAYVAGSWTTASTSTDKYGASYRYKGQGTGAAYLEFLPTIGTPGNYQVSEWHPQGANRTVGAPHVIQHSAGTTTVNVNQQVNGGRWNVLGTFNFAAGTAGYVHITDGFPDGTQYVMADAIKFSYVPPPPTAPGGLTATAVSTSQINLAWTDNSNNEDNFVVARSLTSGGPYTDIITLGANTTSYSNTGLSAGTTYYYVVRAVNAGGSSANSAQASATTVPLPPAAPSGLTATALSSTQIKLTWTDNSANESNFIVARSSTAGGPYTDIATLAANTTVYTNANLSGSTTYYYVVRASNAGGSSANSAEASATTLPVADVIVDNPSATVTGTWTTGTASTDKYGTDYIYKGPGTGSAFVTFTPNILVGGNYQVYEWHSQGNNRTTNAPVVISYNGGLQTVTLNQQINGGKWNLLGTFNFAAGTAGSAKITDAFSGTVVIADAIKFVYVP